MTTAEYTSQPVAVEVAELISDSSLYVRWNREHSQFYAEAVDYGIVGVGETRDEALARMLGTLRAHLRAASLRGLPAAAQPWYRRWRPITARLLSVLTRSMPRRRPAERVELVSH